MKQFRVGIVGLGWVAGAHLETFKKVRGADVVAVCSRRKLDASELSRQFGIPLRVYQDLDAMLKDPEIDVVDICTPHPFHAQQAIRAAEAQKHLIIEKPIAIDWQSAVAMRQAIRQAGVHACVCFEVRYSRQVMAIHDALRRGMIGDLHYAEIDYYHGIGPWYGQYAWNIKRDFGGSSLLTAGCHALDLLLHYMSAQGQAVVEEVVSYQTKSKSKFFTPYEYNTTSVTLVKFQDGRLGKVASVTDCLQPYYFHMHLCGSEGSVLDDKFTSLGWQGLGKDRWSTLGIPVVDSGDVSDHPYEPQFQAFVDSLLRNEPMPYTDFETAFESHRVVFAADRSAEEGRPVKLSEF
ncbi:MAG: Gfo/Idh/MocA family oxidoreductase [Bryobacteraceae bacterium]|nr:Gfo/Idh/MocA family oxidoreductase [Bryobacteraceae bacterium]MDW8377818.1 Gfo/Idh/MocA family oxidoreductase [Bryobacterales bacterium]